MTNADIETVSSRTLSDAKVAARQGEVPRAYKLARSVTSLAPEHPEGWLWRALTAQTRVERLKCLSRVIELDPEHDFARSELYDSLWALLEQEPALIYRDEADELYYIRSAAGIDLAVPKRRETSAPYPPSDPPPLQPAYRWLFLALLGLLPAGLGAIVCAPVAAVHALHVQRDPQTGSDLVRRARLVILGAGFLWVVAFVLVRLLIIHF